MLKLQRDGFAKFPGSGESRFTRAPSILRRQSLGTLSGKIVKLSKSNWNST